MGVTVSYLLMLQKHISLKQNIGEQKNILCV